MTVPGVPARRLWKSLGYNRRQIRKFRRVALPEGLMVIDVAR